MITKITSKRALKTKAKEDGVRLPHGYEVVKRKPTKKTKAADKPKSTNKGLAKLKKITAEAKKIRMHEPSLKWTSAVKLAAKKVK